MKKKYIQPALEQEILGMASMIAQSVPVKPGEDEVEPGEIEGKRRNNQQDDAWSDGLW